MDSELNVTLPTVQERKKLLGFLENVPNRKPYPGGCRRQTLEDPFPLRGGAEHKVAPKKFSTLPRKPKRAKMADKPPLAPKLPVNKPPVPMPRKKGPPPMKPVPYRKHKEYKEHDVSTFKSNYPIQLSANKPTPPVPAEKPPRRYSAKGEPSSEFHRPMKVIEEPIQYGIPSIPVDKGATISSRPRLSTPYVLPEPTELALSNDSISKESTLNVVEVSAPEGSSVGSSEKLYTKAYDHVETNGSDDVNGYAVIPSTRTLAKPPKLQPKTPPSPLGLKPPTTPIEKNAMPATQEDVWRSVPTRQDNVPQQHSTEEYAVVSPTVREVSPDLLSSDDYKHIVHSPTTINTQTPTAPDEYSKLNKLDNLTHEETNGSENVEKSAVPSAGVLAKIPKLYPRKSSPKPPTPTEENDVPARQEDVWGNVPLRQDNVPQQQPTEEYAVVSPTTKVRKVSFPDNYNHTVHSPTPINTQAHTATDEYSKLNRPDNLTTSPAHHPVQLPQEYSVINVPVVSPPPAGNPTQQAGYGQLASGAQVEAEYEIISDEPRRQLSSAKPKVKAKKASQKVKKGQLQSTRDRHDFTAYSEDLIPMTSSRATEKPPPPVKPDRPPLTYQSTDAPGMPQHLSRQGLAIEGDRSPLLSNEELDRAGYETVNTLPGPIEDTTDGGPTVPPRKRVGSPKVEIDIDLINRIQAGKCEPEGEESSYGNQIIIEAVRPENTENQYCPEDPRVGLVLSSTDMFTVPQHAIPGHMGYCDIDLKPPEQHQSVEEETMNPGAGVIDGDTITVKHNSYPNAEGYCDLALNSLLPQTSVSGALTNDDAFYGDIDESDPRKVSGGNESPLDEFEQPNNANDVNSTTHTYELVPHSAKTPPKSKLEDAIPPATKPKPRRLQGEIAEIDSTTQEETKVDNKPLKKAVTVDVHILQRPAPKARPRRAPPPPPVQAAVDDNVLPRMDTGPRVAGDIATLPRGQSLLKSSPTTDNSDISLTSQKQAKSKKPTSKGLFSPKHEGASPKFLKKIFGKKLNSPDTSKINWRKRSLRANKDNPAVSPGTKARTLPATGRTSQDLPISAVDTFDDDDADLYATIQETLQKPLPSPLASASPKMETRRSSGSGRDFEAKQRSSFRKKKVKKNIAVRRTNSAEHLYDTADMSGQGRPSNRARLPNPDEVHAGLYAMVTSRPVDNALQKDSASPTTNGQASNTELIETQDKSLSPIRNSLYEQEGLVVTSLDQKFGTNKVDESFVSSADIEHTVSSAGSVYAIVQTRPKSRKSKSSASSDDTGGKTAHSQPNLDQPPSQVPNKPPRSPAVAHKPPSYQSKSQENTLPKTATSPDNAPLKIDCPVSTRSGPPSFPPPPPPQAKSVTPEPAPIIHVDDPTYEVVDSARKPKASVPQKSKILTSVPAQKQIGSEDGYALVFDDHTDGGKDSELPTPELVHIDDTPKTDSLQDERPPHLYSTIHRDEPEEGPTVSVRMVSHGYATVVDKGRLNGQSSKKKMAGVPRLAPRIKPPPPPPSVQKQGTTANALPTHKPLINVTSTPLEAHTKSLEAEAEGADWTLNQRTSSFSQAESGQPKFLFSQKLCQSLIAVGDNPEALITPCPSPLMMAVTVDEDSDADIMYSTEWESSTGEENEPEHTTVHRPKIFYITREILTTERTFVKGLTLLDKDFRQAVRSANNAHDKPVIPDEAMKLILGNVSSLLNLNSDMLKDLEDRMSRWDEDPRIGDILKIRAPYFKIYTEYISRFDKALKALDEWTKKSPQFAEVVHEFEAQPKCASIPIAGYMLDVVQRITRYKMLMTDYVKHLPEDSKDREDSEKALEAISSTATHVNETIRQMDNFRKVVEVRKRLIGDAGDTLITPYRKLLKEGELLKFSRKERQPRMFFLFNDILIYASSVPPANTTYKVIKRIPLEGMLVEPLNDPEMKYGFQIISTCKSFRLEASNKEEKTQWLTAFETAIKGQAERMKNRERVRQILVADKGGTDETDSLPLGHLAPPWLPDSAVSMCQLCSVHFTLTRRRHHCRACGMIFCSDCSSYYASLKYMNNKTDRVCQSCYEKIDSHEDGSDKSSPVKRPGRLSRGHPKMVNMPSVLLEVKARDQNAQISGYLQTHTSKSKRWKKRWYVVYNLVLYEFERHEDVSAKRSITLPSYQVISPIPRHEDPLVFVLKHAGAGKHYFKVENEEQLERWVDILNKAVRGEIDEDEGATASVLSPEESTSLHSLDSQGSAST